MCAVKTDQKEIIGSDCIASAVFSDSSALPKIVAPKLKRKVRMGDADANRNSWLNFEAAFEHADRGASHQYRRAITQPSDREATAAGINSDWRI